MNLEDLSSIIGLLKALTGFDFTRYKAPVIRRMVLRRMRLHHLATLPDYRQYLEDHAPEVTALYEALLVQITGFFWDPPFSGVDLVSSCNLLVYLEPIRQRKVMNAFHHSLGEKGVLVLGESESTGNYPRLFRAVDKHAKVFVYQEAPVIEISGRRLPTDEASGNSFVEIVFKDNGIGFKEEFAEQIFILFQRLHDKAHYPGTGTGLAICRKIVEYHGGRILARPVPGGGAAFHVFLPEGDF